jgi:hypothetical protein
VAHPAVGLLLVIAQRLVLVGGALALLVAWARRR